MFIKLNKGLIRPFTLADAEGLAEAVRETATKSGRSIIWMTEDYSVDDARAFIRSCGQSSYDDKAYQFGVFDENRRILGGIAVHSIRRDINSGDLGYWTRESQQGKGVAQQAAEWAKMFAFNQLQLDRVNLCIAEDNHASRKIAHHLDACFMGVKLRCFPPSDGVLYTIFKKGNVR